MCYARRGRVVVGAIGSLTRLVDSMTLPWQSLAEMCTLRNEKWSLSGVRLRGYLGVLGWVECIAKMIRTCFNSA